MKRTSRGFTIVELMVTLTILGILAAIATPGFREYTRNTRLTTAQNNLVTALNLARSESQRRSRPVSVCASADGVACGSEADWASGWIVFTDRVGAEAGVVTDADDLILQKWDAVGGDVAVVADQPFVQYLPTGMASLPGDDPDAPALTLAVALTPCKGQTRRIQISETGSLLAKKTNCT